MTAPAVPAAMRAAQTAPTSAIRRRMDLRNTPQNPETLLASHPSEAAPELLHETPPDDSPRSLPPARPVRPRRSGRGCDAERRRPDADLPGRRADDVHRRLRPGAPGREAS